MTSKFSLDERIEQLLQYQAENGHLFVPPTYKTNGLGSFVNNSRAKYRSGKLKAEIIDKLNAIDFIWNVPKGPEKDEVIAWGNNFRKLAQFHQMKGHCKVPPSIAGEANPIHEWCQEQRRLFSKDKLSKERSDKLTKMGFDFFESDEEEYGPPTKRQRTDATLLKEIEALTEEIMLLKEENKAQKEEIMALKGELFNDY